ncbi:MULTISPECIES: riboflavin synthase [Candidatus Nitrosocaldus]|jgi:riboflavin synthase|uniref:Riboflavin synthase n=1 Tax=Candidatus Nitrosocaldus cavascurensis TaxID=2058097 RepID=A0A2K5ANP3_9ARCH|nr:MULTISPECIES: riboflavin synthase [Candidatus Nitrosocaldus]SPC33252.1 Riboflavin synthase [Candidatus Nitrosocaldus cavascurensis]
MFTGIIKCMGIVEDVRMSEGEGSAMTITVDIKEIAARVGVGDSIAVNGVCLTVVALEGSRARFNLVGETIARTNLGMLKRGDSVNLEPSLRVGDSIDGHFVLGHVDGIGRIVERREERDQVIMSIEVPNSLMRYIAVKGSIAVDGVSLTVTSIKDNRFSVALIPHTLQVTTLGRKREGDTVNIEVDMIARYLANLLEHTNILVDTK